MTSARPTTADSGSPPARLFAIVDEIGLDAAVLVSEHAARAAEAALNLVDDEDDAVAIGDAPQRGQEVERRGHEATFAELGLDDDRRDPRRDDLGVEELLQGVERLRARSRRDIRTDTARDRPRARTARSSAGTTGSTPSVSTRAACARESRP